MEKTKLKSESSNKPFSEKDARQILLETGLILFAEKGLDGTTTREIALKAKLNISLISYYFGGKEGLYHAVIEWFALQAHQRLTESLSALDTHGLTKDVFVFQMKKLLKSIIELKLKMPQAGVILQREAIAGLPFSRDIYEGIFLEMSNRVADLFEIAAKKNFIRKDINSKVLLVSMIHGIDGYLLMDRTGVSCIKSCPRLPKDIDDYVDQISKIYLEGILL